MPVLWHVDELKAPGSTPGAFSRPAFSHAAGDAPALALELRPNRSLPPEGFVAFIGLTCGLIAIPMLSLLGTPVVWGMLPFFVLAVGGLWIALRRNAADGTRLVEELTLWSDRMALVRTNPRGPRQEWQANPYWVRLTLHRRGGPVENYLTLSDGGREVELGAFLSPEERAALCARLELALSRLGTAARG